MECLTLTHVGWPGDARRPPRPRQRDRRARRTRPATGAEELADRLEGALDDGVKLLALTIDERAIILASLEDPPDGLSELRAVLLSEHEWRQREGLDS
jgi:hypothetical protein